MIRSFLQFDFFLVFYWTPGGVRYEDGLRGLGGSPLPGPEPPIPAQPWGWYSVAVDIGLGVAEAFAEANTKGGTGDRSFILLQQGQGRSGQWGCVVCGCLAPEMWP